MIVEDIRKMNYDLDPDKHKYYCPNSVLWLLAIEAVIMMAIFVIHIIGELQ